MATPARPSRFAPILRFLFRSLSVTLPVSRLLAVEGVIPNLTYQPAEQFTAISPQLSSLHLNQPSVYSGYVIFAGNAVHEVWDIANPYAPVKRATFLRRTGGTETNSRYVKGDLTYQPLPSADLINWNITPIYLPNPPNLPAAPEGIEWTSYAIPATSDTTYRGFMKLKVIAE